jgi:plastocyanin
MLFPVQSKEEAMPAKKDTKSSSGFTQLAAGFAVLISLAALLGVALRIEDGNKAKTATAATATTAVAAPESVKLVVKSDEEKGKKGPDGNWHDAFLPADFSVKAGASVRVTVYNYDDMPHTFTATDLGVNAKVPAGAEDKPSKVSFTFQAPQEAGSFEWFCALPCDPWSMTHYGYMKGYVKVV